MLLLFCSILYQNLFWKGDIMKLFKKALSLLLSVVMVATMFTFLSVTPATAAVAIPEGYEIDEQVTFHILKSG